MSRIVRQLSVFFASALFAGALAATAQAKDKVKVGFIGPLTGGVSVNGIGGRNSAELAVKLRNADPKAKYEYELVVLDDECKPNVAVQVATKMAADKEIIAGATHYCSATAIATVDVYHKFGFPIIVWGAVLPDVTYRNKYAEVHRVNGTMIDQNDANAELISKLGFKNCRRNPRHHRLRQGSQRSTSARRSPSWAARSSVRSASPRTSRTSPPN